jgi:O-acetylserine/cysteine efflux transporter
MRRPPRGQWPLLVAVVTCNVVLHFGLSFWSLKLAGDLASPAIVMQSYVPMAVLLAWWMRGEGFAWRTGLAILVSFAGILVLGFDPIVLDNPQSLLLMLVSAAFLAVGTVLMRGLAGIDALSMQAWSAWIGLPPLLIWSALVESNGMSAVASASWIAWGGRSSQRQSAGRKIIAAIMLTMNMKVSISAHVGLELEVREDPGSDAGLRASARCRRSRCRWS